MVPKVFYAIALHKMAHDMVHKLPCKGVVGNHFLRQAALKAFRVFGGKLSGIHNAPVIKTPFKLKPVVDFERIHKMLRLHY